MSRASEQREACLSPTRYFRGRAAAWQREAVMEAKLQGLLQVRDEEGKRAVALEVELAHAKEEQRALEAEYAGEVAALRSKLQSAHAEALEQAPRLNDK